MSRMFAIYQRELSYFFNSIVAYVVIMMFVFLGGYFFYNLVAVFNAVSIRTMQNPVASEQLSLTFSVFQPLFGNLATVMLLIMPLLTMRLLADERKMGTAELLFTYPVSDWSVILGKFFATTTVFAAMLLLTACVPLLLRQWIEPEWGPLLGSYLGMLLLGMAFIAMGLFFSSLSDSQIVAGMLTFGCGLFFLIIGWILPFVSQGAASVVAELSILKHFDNFSKGIIDTNDLVYYVNFTAFFLFLCSRVLESNRWRG